MTDFFDNSIEIIVKKLRGTFQSALSIPGVVVGTVVVIGGVVVVVGVVVVGEVRGSNVVTTA